MFFSRYKFHFHPETRIFQKECCGTKKMDAKVSFNSVLFLRRLPNFWCILDSSRACTFDLCAAMLSNASYWGWIALYWKLSRPLYDGLKLFPYLFLWYYHKDLPFGFKNHPYFGFYPRSRWCYKLLHKSGCLAMRDALRRTSSPKHAPC